MQYVEDGGQEKEIFSNRGRGLAEAWKDYEGGRWMSNRIVCFGLIKQYENRRVITGFGNSASLQLLEIAGDSEIS